MSLASFMGKKKDFEEKSSKSSCGERGIRTLDTLERYASLAGTCFRPLSHLSLSNQTFLTYLNIKEYPTNITPFSAMKIKNFHFLLCL